MRGITDSEAGVLLAEASSAICVQRFDGSRNSAIHTTYRISLRSSSLQEPRYPLLRVVFGYSNRQCQLLIALDNVLVWSVLERRLLERSPTRPASLAAQEAREGPKGETKQFTVWI